MMDALYAGDPEIDRTRFPITIQTLLADPARGHIVLIMQQSALCGYALLIPYWSNEFGGSIVFVDELFLKPDARGQGIGRSFFNFISHTKPFNAVAAVLEVSPTNTRARKLYESVGFRQRPNDYLACPLPQKGQPADND